METAIVDTGPLVASLRKGDACLVRMSEILPDPVIVTTDSDFHIYRRHGRRVVPVRTPWSARER